jgi:hypothetical protein
MLPGLLVRNHLLDAFLDFFQVYDIQSQEQRSGSGSVFNVGEAQVCARALRTLADEHLGGGMAGAEALRKRVAILTPYRRQVILNSWVEFLAYGAPIVQSIPFVVHRVYSVEISQNHLS